jgi:hypothetical protein
MGYNSLEEHRMSVSEVSNPSVNEILTEVNHYAAAGLPVPAELRKRVLVLSERAQAEVTKRNGMTNVAVELIHEIRDE